jgi:hypothetical protein
VQSKWLLAAAALLALLLVAAITSFALNEDDDDSAEASGPTTIPQATPEQLAAAGLDELPLAPKSARVDLVAAPFSNPTDVTNPLFPISSLHSAVLNGTVEGKAFRTETTLLPWTRIIEWPKGQRVETLVSQYVAYLDGRIEEVALDHYAQDDDGAVWYFGEDVFNYEDGVIADREGTWLAGREGPAAMIMPADPQAGDVYFSENNPGLVFEQVTVKDVGRTVQGPQGQVEGAIVGAELHQDRSREDKTFAPGYGEFFTGSGGEVEALALAVPIDKLSGPVPAQLEALLSGAIEMLGDKKAAPAAVARMRRAWRELQAREVPPRLEPVMSAALEGLPKSAFDVANAALDLELRYRPPAEIDRERFDLWARRLIVDANADNAIGVTGDLVVLEWIRDRIAHTLVRVDRTRINSHLVALRAIVNDEDLSAAAAEAARLGRLAQSQPGSP